MTSVDFNLNRDNIIQEAMELIGVIGAGESPSSDDIASASRSLNMMVKSWMADGIRVWKVSEASLTLVASQASYTLGVGGDLVIDKPLRITEMRRRDSDGNDTPMFSLSRDEYMMLSDKTSTGSPTQFYYQPDLTTGTLYIWPTASSSVASDETIRFSYYSLLGDFDAASDNPDFPSEWLECLSYNLAVRLAAKFGVPASSIQLVIEMAGMLKEQMYSWDQEFESIYLMPDFRYS